MNRKNIDIKFITKLCYFPNNDAIFVSVALADCNRVTITKNFNNKNNFKNLKKSIQDPKWRKNVEKEKYLYILNIFNTVGNPDTKSSIATELPKFKKKRNQIK